MTFFTFPNAMLTTAFACGTTITNSSRAPSARKSWTNPPLRTNGSLGTNRRRRNKEPLKGRRPGGTNPPPWQRAHDHEAHPHHSSTLRERNTRACTTTRAGLRHQSQRATGQFVLLATRHEREGLFHARHVHARTARDVTRGHEHVVGRGQRRRRRRDVLLCR